MTVATYAAAQLLRVLPRARITRAVGRLCDARLPPALATAVVNLYVRAYRVDLTDAMLPDGAFASFNAFFTRALRDGVRPECADTRAIVSPADGRLESMGPVHAGGRLKIKGRDYSVADLVGDTAEAARYEGGQFAVVYLSPRDYHRVHAPASGTISLVRSMPGDLYPVNAIGERHVPLLFARNRRVAIVIDTEAHGRVTVVMVAAMIVGRITVTGVGQPSEGSTNGERRRSTNGESVRSTDLPLGEHVLFPPRRVRRGDEIGIFHLGSTAVVITPPGTPPWQREAGPVRLGEPLNLASETAQGNR